jgi:hypothetical protein
VWSALNERRKKVLKPFKDAARAEEILGNFISYFWEISLAIIFCWLSRSSLSRLAFNVSLAGEAAAAAAARESERQMECLYIHGL